MTHIGVLKKEQETPLPFLFQFTLTSDHSANKLNKQQKQIVFPPSPKQLLYSQDLQGKGIYVISSANTAVETQFFGRVSCLFFMKAGKSVFIPSCLQHLQGVEFPVLITLNYCDDFSA